MENPTITDREFDLFSQLIYRHAGIHMTPAKKPLVGGRLLKRLKHHQMTNFGDYYQLLMSGVHAAELQTAVDLLTTNETYFFREQKHFDALCADILPRRPAGQLFRVWSAASSSGQEAYSTAMLLADKLGDSQWEILGSDISSRVLDQAQRALYPIEQAEHIPRSYLERYCLKGTGTQQGFFLIDRKLREKVRFIQANLIGELPQIGLFDVIFLRNVMIYFDAETKRKVAAQVASRLRPGGYLLIGHSESLNGICDNLTMLRPSIYVKPC